MLERPGPNTRFLIVAYYAQLITNFVALGAITALLFYSNAKFQDSARQATLGNRAVIEEVRRDLDIHAHASGARNCAIARELRSLVKISPDLPVKVLDQVARFTDQACKIVPIETPAPS